MIVGLVAVACNTNNPVLAPQEAVIKSESKWLVNNETEARLHLISYREYDQDKQLVKSEEYDERGIIKQRVTLSYQPNQRLEVVTLYSNGSELNTTHNTYTLSSAGKVVQRVERTQIGDTISIIRYDYDYRGNVIVETTFDKNGNQTGNTRFKYEYDSQGFVVSRLVVNGPLDLFETRDTLVYNMDSRTIDRFTYNSLGALEVIYTYHYNNNGSIVKEVWTDRDGLVIKKYKYEYIYF
jgi:hypothetical protein